MSWTGFQSAPPHGGRLFVCGQCEETCSFNPRPRTGGDTQRPSCHGAERVSIRAPARGATDGVAGAVVAFWFQSAPPHGGRPGVCGRERTAITRFNPRPRTGGDAAIAIGWGFHVVSIRAPARGATPIAADRYYVKLVSIRAPARGATQDAVRLARV